MLVAVVFIKAIAIEEGTSHHTKGDGEQVQQGDTHQKQAGETKTGTSGKTLTNQAQFGTKTKAAAL